MRKIIVLYKTGNKGKTETLNYVIDILQAITTRSTTSPVANYTDRKDTLVFNGLIVSVCTAGDNPTEIKQNEAYFNKNKCDIAITASRSRGGSVKAIKAIAQKNGAMIQRVKKSIGSNNVYHLNMSDAHQIISLLY